ncbi:membrane-bound lytic murein transglycosylase B [Aeromonas sp. BIGb0405]|jgi:membrane-bound lytic murein transglycosylase B|nr:membrane-bound lytic murein transglycosylase B [Aeromonas sp. BIGb0405]UBO73286.1 lytic murein transglycosylase B [Aeromonas rivuli]
MLRRASRLLLLAVTLPTMAAPVATAPPSMATLTTLAERQAVPLADLQAAAGAARLNPEILALMQRPWEAKPWYQYRALFVTEQRIQAGVRFWQENHTQLSQAEQTYRVPAALITAILGVETAYGKQMGRHGVLDSLYTLGFYYPERADFFAKEFAQLVLLGQEEGLSLQTLKGSYAGAMGMGQFMPSSYRHYAVDFDGDGKRDLFGNKADAIGSVANYFAEHGWRWQEPVVEPAEATLPVAESLIGKAPEPTLPWQTLSDAGLRLATPPDANTRVRLLALDKADGPSYWVARHNFYVINRYNRSPLYGMAVYQLSQAIQDAYAAQPSPPSQPDLVAGRL